MSSVVLLFLFFLPLYEAPKNIFSVAILVVFFYMVLSKKIELNSNSKKLFGFLFAYLTTLFVPIIDIESADWWDFFIDTVSWWCMPMTTYCVFLYIQTRKLKINLITWFFNLSLSIAIIWALLSDSYQINSVGHVNQSALFAVQALALNFWLFAKSERLVEKVIVILALALSFLYIFISNSLLALGLSAVLIGTHGLWLRCLDRQIISISVVFLVIGFSYLVFFERADSLVDKVDSRVSGPALLSHRDVLFRTYIPMVGDALYFGHGIGRYAFAVTETSMQKKLSIKSPDQWNLESPKFLFTSHAHSFYGQILIERGLIGLAIILSSICFLVKRYANLKYRSNESNQLLFSTLLIVLFGGFFQTTFFVEHGWLAMVSLALCFADSYRKGDSGEDGAMVS